MKVKIIKAKRASYWYATEIGKVFDVVTKDGYYVVNNDSHYIDMDDAEVVPETLPYIAIDLRKASRTMKDKICDKLFKLGISFNNYSERDTSVTPTPKKIRDELGILYVTKRFRSNGRYGLEWNPADTDNLGELLLSVTDVLSGRNDELLKKYKAFPDKTEPKPITLKIDLSWVKGTAREVLSKKIQEKLYENGVSHIYDGIQVVDFTGYPYIYVVNNKISWADSKAIFDAEIDGTIYTKETIAAIPEVSVNNALNGKFWTYSSVPKKEGQKYLYYHVDLSKYTGKEREVISKEVQKMGFSKGFAWSGDGAKYLHTYAPRLVFWTEDHTICYSDRAIDPTAEPTVNKILTVEEVLSGALPNVK